MALLNIPLNVSMRQTLNLSIDNQTVSIPAGYSILQVIVKNSTANAVTGGLKIGTSSGGLDVATALAIIGNSLTCYPDSNLLKRIFSDTVDTQLFISSVIALNGAVLELRFVLRNTLV